MYIREADAGTTFKQRSSFTVPILNSPKNDRMRWDRVKLRYMLFVYSCATALCPCCLHFNAALYTAELASMRQGSIPGPASSV